MDSIGHYRILSKLGAGGMGEVYRARDTVLERDVALKVLPGAFTNNQERLARFEREARTLASLNHPHIGAIYGMEDADGTRVLVLELVEGETLADRLRRGAVPVSDGLSMARQIAEALSAAHQKGIVHRDLKPANIQITPEGVLKVLDFGLAKFAITPGEEPSRTMTIGDTGTGVIVGTAGYMSPEQARGKPLDAGSDVWAFGCVLYEMLTGRRAFAGETFSDTIAGVLQREPDWHALPAGTPPNIRELLRRMLRKDARERPGDVGEVRAAIDEALAASPRRRRVTRPRVRSLAVLPLASLSSDPEQEFFADGMTDALITNLAQIRALRVISRTSVMQYKGARKPLPQIARELNVEAVLEGTVVRSGSRVRIAAQLIDATTDTHIWAKNYESELRDILAVQSEVAQGVAQEIRLTLTPQEKARFTATKPVDPEAYELYLKGRYYWYRRTPDALKKSLEYLERAAEKDGSHALTHAGIADTYNSLGWDLFAALPPVDAFPHAKAAAQKALQLDPHCAEAHAALGWAATAYDWDWAAAEKAFRRSVELKPHYGPAHMWYSHLLHALGRSREAYDEGERAIECDPVGVILSVHMGWHFAYERRYEDALVQLQKTLELEPGFILARLFLGEANEQMGRYPEAIAEFERAVELSGRRPVYLAGLGHAYAAAGEPARARKIIDELQLLGKQTYVAARGIAEIYIGLGDYEQAFAWLERAVEQRNGWLFHTKTNPRYDPLRGEAGYPELLRRIGLA